LISKLLTIILKDLDVYKTSASPTTIPAAINEKQITGIKHPPPVTSLPTFLWRPDFVVGIPVIRAKLLLALDMPTKRFHENPPLFI